MIEPETFARYAALPVPRYTSYPTAPNFVAAPDDCVHRKWLREVPAVEPVSVYLHVPFCRHMCWYCGCHTTVARRGAPVTRYVSRLEKEIRLVASELGRRRTVAHLHWGGGTPTLLTPGAVRKLDDFLEAQHILACQENHLLGHAVATAKVAAVGDRDSNIADPPAEAVDHRAV